MSPQETTTLLGSSDDVDIQRDVLSRESESPGSQPKTFSKLISTKTAAATSWTVALIVAVVLAVSIIKHQSEKRPLGPYKLIERHQGKRFFDSYDFFNGDDSKGSAGFNTYVGKERALQIGLINHTVENGEDFIFMRSKATEDGPRESIRLEGKRRFDRGLFILDLAHMPTGCGVWPAFWMTDEDAWPDNGEIDIVEGVNFQSAAKTALHTSESCSMFAHVPDYARTGVWDTATGIPDTFTGDLDNYTRVKADNCWNMAPHQWGNQGCVAVNTDNETLGAPLNARGGGVYALEWDPANGYIKSWVFGASEIPDNLAELMSEERGHVSPEPETWGLPYGYFAIGDRSGCSTDHFKHMRVIFNLAFCGTVSGNRFFGDCPEQAKLFNEENDPILSCNAWIASNPKAMEEAYWKVRSVYIYEREMVSADKFPPSESSASQDSSDKQT